MINLLQLQGYVCRTPVCKVSPVGIHHCQFVVEHRSQQQEAKLMRLACCKMPVVASGDTILSTITVGMQLRIEGFLHQQPSRDGLSKLVLHAKKIELIDSGDKPNGTLFSSS